MRPETNRNIPRTRDGKVRLRSLDDLDRRTAAGRAAQNLITGLENDLGGAEVLSVAQREICKRAALAGAILEDWECRWVGGEPIEVEAYATLANTQRRLLTTIGLTRRARDVTPDADRRFEKFVEAFEREEVGA